MESAVMIAGQGSQGGIKSLAEIED